MKRLKVGGVCRAVERQNKFDGRFSAINEEVIVLKDYAKIILYAYPLLKTVEKDYEDHIGNQAMLSCEGRWSTEKTAEYIAGEILEMRRLEWLKGKVGDILAKLSEEEKTLVAIRYFGKKKRLKALFEGSVTPSRHCWTRRSYFRRQTRLGEKLGEALAVAGVTEEVFLREFSNIDIFKKVEALLEKRKVSRGLAE